MHFRFTRLLIHSLASSALILVGLLPGASLAQSGPPLDHDPAFLIRNWTANDGLPVSGVSDVYQEEDGFLWLATPAGVARFDGSRFAIFDTGSNPELPSNRFTQFSAEEKGFYLLQTENAEILLFNGQTFLDLTKKFGFSRRSGYLSMGQGRLRLFTDSGILDIDRRGEGSYVSREPLSAYGGIRMEDGTQWLGSPDGLIRVDAAGARSVFTTEDGLPSNDVRALWSVGSDLLIATPAGTGLFRQGTFRPVHLEDAPGVGVIGYFILDLDGETLVATSRGMRRLEGTKLVKEFSKGTFASLTNVSMSATPISDVRGDLWYVFNDGLYRNDRLVLRRAGNFNRLFASRSGGIWVAHNTDGLFLVLPSAVRTVGIPEGLTGQNAYGLVQSADGAMWVGLLDRSRFVEYRDGQTRRSFIMGEPWAAGVDAGGTVWLGGERLCRVEGETCVPAVIPGFTSPVRAIQSDSNGNLWVGTQSQLWVRKQEDASWSQVRSEDGSPEWVRWVAEGPDGTLYFGTFGKGLGVLRDGHLQYLNRSSGFPSDNIRSVLAFGPDEIWVGSEDSGLIVIHGADAPLLADASWTTIGRSEGLPDNSIHAMLQDQAGDVWVNSNQGIYRVNPSAVHAFVRGERDSVPLTLVNDKSGMRNREGNGGMQSAGFVDQEGLIYFPTQQGVAVVDPSLLGEESSLKVQVVSLTTPGRTVRPNQDVISLSAEERSIQIEVSSPHFVTPERVAFRYRERDEGEAWIPIGTEGRIILNNLPPGKHDIEIQAGLSGNWSQETAHIGLSRQATFFESVWFIILLVGFGTSSTALILLGRVRLIRRRNMQLEEQIQERTRTIQDQAERLAALDDLKSQFFSNISHELRTPLTLIKGPVSKLLQDNAGGEPALTRQLAVVDRNVDRLSTLVNEILDLTALEAGHFELNPQVGELSAFVTHIAGYFGEAAVERDIQLDISVPDKPLIWTFDARRMEHVLVNLIGNALKFSSEGGSIRISLTVDESDCACISVTDTGSGIDAKDLPHLFERYFRGSNREGIKGSGIGLAMSQELVQKHGGTLQVQSVKGLGSTFTVILPRDFLRAVTIPVHESDRLRLSGGMPLSSDFMGEPHFDASAGRATLLIAEDNPDLRQFLAEALIQDYHILTASDGKEALELCQETVPDLVISDVMMPRMTGLELCNALKSDVPTSHIPVILLTAKGDIDSKAEGLRIGADVYLGKPFETRELLAYVESLLENRLRLQRSFQSNEAGSGMGPVDSSEVSALADGLSTVDRVFLESTLTAMETALADADLNVDTLADELHLSRRQFHRKVEALTGFTPGDLLRRKRVEAACRLMEHGNISLKEIGTAVGFRSESGFRKAFKDQLGVAPSQWKA